MTGLVYRLFGTLSPRRFQFKELEMRIEREIKTYVRDHNSMPNTLQVQMPGTIHAGEQAFIVSAVANGLFDIYKWRPQRVNTVYVSFILSEKEPEGLWLNSIKLFPSYTLKSNEKGGTQVIAVSEDKIDVDQVPNIPDGVSIFWIDRLNFWVLLPSNQTEAPRARRALFLDKDCDIKLEGGRNAVDLYEGITWLGGKNGNSSMPDAHYIRFDSDEIPADAARIEIKGKSVLITPGCCSTIIVDGITICHETQVYSYSDITICGATFIIK